MQLLCLLGLFYSTFSMARITTIQPIAPSVESSGFTMMIATYKRTHLLPALLSHLTTNPAPSLYQISIIWQNVQVPIPSFLTPSELLKTYGDHIPITVRISKINSMNQRFIPFLDEENENQIPTRDVMIFDDDLVLRNADLEWGYQTYLDFNPVSSPSSTGRIVGFTGRDFKEDGKGGMDYILQPSKSYSMILSNAAWFRKDWLSLYSNQNKLQIELREYVDSVFNCDDLLINFIVSNLTHLPPLLLQPSTPLRSIPTSGLWNSSPDPATKVTARPDHFQTRALCLAHFFDSFAKFNTHELPHYPLFQSHYSISQDVSDTSRQLLYEESWEAEVWVTVPSTHINSKKAEPDDELEEFDKIAEMSDSEFAIWQKKEFELAAEEERQRKELYQKVFGGGGKGKRDEL